MQVYGVCFISDIVFMWYILYVRMFIFTSMYSSGSELVHSLVRHPLHTCTTHTHTHAPPLWLSFYLVYPDSLHIRSICTLDAHYYYYWIQNSPDDIQYYNRPRPSFAVNLASIFLQVGQNKIKNQLLSAFGLRSGFRGSTRPCQRAGTPFLSLLQQHIYACICLTFLYLFPSILMYYE